MQDSERTRATELLGNLQGWAEFICESLHEPLDSAVEQRALREARQLSWILREKLYVLRTQLEFSARAT